MLDRCKAVAARAELDAARFDLRRSDRRMRPNVASRSRCSNGSTLDGSKSLETTMRYLVPATDVHKRLDELEVPGLSVPGVNPKGNSKGNGR